MRPRAVTLSATPQGWTFDAAERRMRSSTLFLFNDPHNPTGHRFSPAERRLIVKLCRRHGVLVVTDEIYEWILYGRRPARPLAVLDPQNVVIVSSISKTARATGWRIGWVVASANGPSAREAVHDQLVACVATPLQIGVARLLELDKERFTDIWEDYWAKRDVLGAALGAAGFDLGPTPRGAYYWFVGYKGVPSYGPLDPLAAAMTMTRDYGVACVPGDNLRISAARDPSHGQRYLRFAFCRSLGVLQAAGERLAAMGWNPHWQSCVMCTRQRRLRDVHNVKVNARPRTPHQRPRSARAGSRPAPGAPRRRARRGASRGRALESQSRPVDGEPGARSGRGARSPKSQPPPRDVGFMARCNIEKSCAYVAADVTVPSPISTRSASALPASRREG